MLHFFAVKGYDWSNCDRGATNISQCTKKFSCHLIVKHETHMFPSLEELRAFIELLRAHKDWQRCSDIIDTSVYEETQLFRVPFAVKAPKFDSDTRSFDLSTPQNVLLPVDPKSGVLVIPQLAPSRIQVKLSLDRWKSYLVTTPFMFDRIAQPLKSALYMLLLSVPMAWIWSDILTFDSMQSRVQSYVTVLFETYLKLQQLQQQNLHPFMFVPNDWLHWDSLQPVQTLSHRR